ncbi:hypothetical protein TrispH2_004361 [Trichoplax sp. H2]|nr:hypothetical protein TrispH2_004361 [Trichoplax sp. H2]|eukprot:RDD44514.1 hypothetical protein TrispH2_004361 [Trichoplax sp. H2]
MYCSQILVVQSSDISSLLKLNTAYIDPTATQSAPDYTTIMEVKCDYSHCCDYIVIIGIHSFRDNISMVAAEFCIIGIIHIIAVVSNLIAPTYKAD